MVPYETYEEEEEDDEVEVERPKPRPKPEPSKPALVVGGGGLTPERGLVPEMPDMPAGDEERPSTPRAAQAHNDRQVADLFARQKGAKVIHMHRRGVSDIAPQPTSHLTSQAAIDAQQAAQIAAQKAAAAKQAALAAQQAQQQAAEANRVMQQNVQTLQTQAPPVQRQDQQPPPVERVPVRRSNGSLVLLGVAAAALVGAVAFSMMMSSDGEEEEENEGDGEGPEEVDLDVPKLEDYPEPPEVIEGELVEDAEEEDESRKSA